jgi:high-affinity Fe2+/Pb2+ permease
MEKENIKSNNLWIGLIIAFIVAIVYNFSLNIDMFNKFIGDIAEKSDSVFIVFALPGILSFVIFYIFFKDLHKSLIVGIMCAIIFLIVFILTIPEIH